MHPISLPLSSFMKRLWWGFLILLCGYLGILTLLGRSGAIGFFSPDSLEYRSQSERLLLGTEIPLYRSPYEYHEHELVKYLTSKGYWTPRETDSPRWFVLFHWNQMWRDGESTFHRRFFWKTDRWIDWSNKNPDQAAKFWPHILELLRSGDEDLATEVLTECGKYVP